MSEKKNQLVGFVFVFVYKRKPKKNMSPLYNWFVIWGKFNSLKSLILGSLMYLVYLD